MCRACSTKGGKEDCLSVIVGKPERKDPLGKSRRSWVDNVKTDLRQDGGGVDWIEVTQGNELLGSFKSLHD
jgi:hypothetical protein